MNTSHVGDYRQKGASFAEDYMQHRECKHNANEPVFSHDDSIYVKWIFEGKEFWWKAKVITA